MSEQAWTREAPIADMLKPKLPFWSQALDAYEKGDTEKLAALGQNDLVGGIVLDALEITSPGKKKG